MSDLSNGPDPGLQQAFHDWSYDEPPRDFARDLAQLAISERAQSGTRRTRHGVVVPLLLAAFFVSLGAAAAWSRFGSPEIGAVEVSAPELTTKREKLSFAVHARGASAERERAKSEPPESGRRANTRLAPPTFAKSQDAQEIESEASQRPRAVHFPSCECGTSGVVCSCAD